MLPAPLDGFIRALREIRLLDENQFRELAASLAPAAGDDAALGEMLVQRGWLTRYQCEQVLQGRGPSLVVGPFLLLELLGEGGMGQVFKARQRGLSRVVALKRIQPQRLDNPDARRRFQREVDVAISLDHPNIVRVHHAELDGDAPWLSMEFLEGADLGRLVRQRGPLPPPEACEWVRQAALGLQHAHEKKLVHRDIKPPNLMLTSSGRAKVVKVLDMGLALTESSTTLTGFAGAGLMGTGDYIAPEQVTDPHKVDIRADVYSLGCTLYHLLAGCPPYDGTHPAARPALHLTARPVALEKRRSEVPPALAEVVRRMMARKREERYPTPGDVVRALAPFCPAAAESLIRDAINSIGMKFVTVPKGTFWMGGGGGKPGDKQVTVEQFQIGIYPVTQEQWQAVMGANPSYFSRSGGGKEKVKAISDADLKLFPVESVCWDDPKNPNLSVKEFLKRLNAREKTADSGWLYRLPTEAEWEYACRGGATSKEDCSFHFYFDDALTNDLSSDRANFNGNFPDGKAGKGRYLERTEQVASYRSNKLGTCDMQGNVWEWCEDSFVGGPARVIRGGCWSFNGSGCRASNRCGNEPAHRNGLVGFRLVRVPSRRA